MNQLFENSASSGPLSDWINLNTLDGIDRFMMYGSDHFDGDFVGVVPHKFSMSTMFESGGLDVETNDDVTRPGGQTPRDVNLIVQKLSNSMMNSLGISDSNDNIFSSHQPNQNCSTTNELCNERSVEKLFQRNYHSGENFYCGLPNPDSSALRKNFCHIWGWGADDNEDSNDTRDNNKKGGENDKDKAKNKVNEEEPKVGRSRGHTRGCSGSSRNKSKKYGNKKTSKVLRGIDCDVEDSDDDIDERQCHRNPSHLGQDSVSDCGSKRQQRENEQSRRNVKVDFGSASRKKEQTSGSKTKEQPINPISGTIKFGDYISDDSNTLNKIDSSSFSIPSSSQRQNSNKSNKRTKTRPSRKDAKRTKGTGQNRKNLRKRASKSQSSKSTRGSTKRAPLE